MDANSKGQFCEEEVICQPVRVCPIDFLLVARGKKSVLYSGETRQHLNSVIKFNITSEGQM